METLFDAVIGLLLIGLACSPFVLIVIAIFIGAALLARRNGKIAEQVWSQVAADLGLVYTADAGNTSISGVLDGIPVLVEIATQREIISRIEYAYGRTIPWTIVRAALPQPAEVQILVSRGLTPDGWELVTLGDEALDAKYRFGVQPGGVLKDALPDAAIDVLSQAPQPIYLYKDRTLMGFRFVEKDAERLKHALKMSARLANAL